MEKEKCPGGNQGLKNIDKDITGLEKKNQHQLEANTAELGTFIHTLFGNATGGYISLRGFHLKGGIAFNAEGYLFDNPSLLSAASRLATHVGISSRSGFLLTHSHFQRT